jgi:flagellin
MPQIINTNIASLNAQRNLNTSQSSLQTSLQRLSSGLRINSAKDDAAGLSISERMGAQIRGLNQAVRNANDGISLAQTAEGALGSMGDALQRIRELAVQSANATNSSSDRAALQNEVSQLVGEITRVGNTTNFNNLKVLDGSYTGQQYQVGANAGETIAVSIGDARATSLGATAVTSDATGILSSTSLTTGITLNGTVISTATATTMTDVMNAINAQTGTTGVTAARSTSNQATVAYTSNATAGQISVNGVAVTVTSSMTGANLINAINAVSTQTGVTAAAGTGTNIVFTGANGSDIVLKDDSTTDYMSVVGTTNSTFTAGLQLSSKLGSTITVANSTLGASLNLQGAATNYQVSTLDISSIAGANSALQTVDFALTQVNGTRAQLGAIQSRFMAVVGNLQQTTENLSAAKSRITDADFAAETANLTRAQILQQAGTAMLAQANALPNNVLTLLKG